MKQLSDILVVTDMDGTLLTRNQVLTNANMAAIKLFTKLGGKFTIATGRVVESVLRYPELLPYLSPAITNGGCTVFDFRQNKTIQNSVLPKDTTIGLVREIKAKFSDVGIVVMSSNFCVYLVAHSPYAQQLFRDEKITYFMSPMNDIPQPWNKILFAAPRERLIEIEELLKTKELADMQFLHTSNTYFEIMPEGVNKGTALKFVCELCNVPLENTIAIGDYYNDIDMMNVAGKSAVMQNAPKDVKARANIEIGHCNFSAVGQFLYDIVKEYE